MIIFRLKLFARRTPLDKDIRKEFEPKEIVNQSIPLYIKIERTNDFNIQYNSSSNTNRNIINEYIKNFSISPKSRFEDCDVSFANTHFLADMSNTSTSNLDKRSIVMSKSINKQDRFNYRMYLPEKYEIDGKIFYTQKIVLCSCSEHTINGMSGAYVNNQTGNTWHPKKKPSRFKIKLGDKEKNKNKNKSKKKHK